MHNAPRFFALVPCAGVGQRAGTAGPKQYSRLQDHSVVAHTLLALASVSRLTATLVVLAPDDTQFPAQAPDFVGPGAWWAPCGGPTRAATVAAGLLELRSRGVLDDDWVLVHDAARCLVLPAWVDRLIDACQHDAVGGLLALPVADTLKMADAQGRVGSTVERVGKWLAQTPQMFRLGLLQRALQQALQQARPQALQQGLQHAGQAVTDESSAVEALGLSPLLVLGDQQNFKLTWPADFGLAQRLLETR